MAGTAKLMTAGGGGVSLTPASSIASDITVNIPVVSGNTGASSVATTDANGNLGLGVTPSAWYNLYNTKAIQVGSLSSFYYDGYNGTTSVALNAIQTGATSYQYISGTSSAATRYSQFNGQHQWYTAPSGTAGNAITFTQAMTLDASGNLLVGTTSGGSKIMCSYAYPQTGSTWISNTASSHYAFTFQNSNGQVGSITTAASGTAYNTSSDYRLKENIQPMQNALATVAQLNPVTYTWKADGSDGQGFIAHELQAVVPDCVTGEKDAVDAEGNPVYQGIDTSFLVATLTKAIQEQQAQIETLTAKVAALEAK